MLRYRLRVSRWLAIRHGASTSPVDLGRVLALLTSSTLQGVDKVRSQDGKLSYAADRWPSAPAFSLDTVMRSIKREFADDCSLETSPRFSQGFVINRFADRFTAVKFLEVRASSGRPNVSRILFEKRLIG